MISKGTVYHDSHQFIYGGLDYGKLLKFDKESRIEFQERQNSLVFIEDLFQLKTNECRRYQRFIINETDDSILNDVYIFLMFEVFINTSVHQRCLNKIDNSFAYIPELIVFEIEQEILKNKEILIKRFSLRVEVLEKHIKLIKNYLLMRLESYYLEQMLLDTEEDVILVIDDFRVEYLQNIPPNVKGIIITQEVENPQLLQLLSSEYEISIAQYKIIPSLAKDVIIDGYKNKLIFNPSLDEKGKFHERILKMTFKLGESPNYSTDKINIYAQAINSNNIDRITSESWFNGIAPFKTEYFYISNGILPTVDEQVKFYVNIFNQAKGMPIFLRIPDFRPDKPLNYMIDAFDESGIYKPHHLVIYDHFSAIAQAVKLTNADVKVVIPRVARHTEIAEWKMHLFMAFEYEKMPTPEMGYVLETESAYEFYFEYPQVDFVIIGFNDLIEETTDFYNRFSIITANKFQEIFLPPLKDIHQFLSKRAKPIKHILAGNLITNPFILKKLLNYGFTDFAIPVNKIRLIEPVLTEYCNTRGKYIGVHHERIKKQLLKNSKDVDKVVDEA